MKIGIISQCMVKPRQINDQYLGNLALKINLKVCGALTLLNNYIYISVCTIVIFTVCFCA